MVTSKKTHIIFRSIFLVISLVGIIGSFGTYRGVYNPNFYLYFTNLSIYFCFFSVLAMLLQDIKYLKSGITHKETDMAPVFRFSVCVMVTLTFLVYNVILSNLFTNGYWTDFRSLIMHLICPIMYIVDYMLFSKHRILKLWAPACACIFPFIYVLFILVRAEIYAGTGKFAYPYFFLDIYALGFWNVMLYIFIIALGVLLFGYELWAYDKLVRNENGKLVWDFSPLPKPEPVVVESEQVEVSENVKIEDKPQEVEKIEEVKEAEQPKTRKPRTTKVQTETQDTQEQPKTRKPRTVKPKNEEDKLEEPKKQTRKKKVEE